MKYRMLIRTSDHERYSFSDLTEQEVDRIKREIDGNRSSPNSFFSHNREDGSVIMINIRHTVTIEFVPYADLAQ